MYNINRERTAAELTKVLNLNSIKPAENEVLRYAIKLYGERSLDFADCLLIGYHSVYGYEICTFDKKITKILQDMELN